MTIDVAAIESEVRAVCGEMTLEWSEYALYLKLKMIEASKNGGITSYTLNGRTVTKDLRWWQDAYTFAKAQANVDDTGGIMGCPISFRSPSGRNA